MTGAVAAPPRLRARPRRSAPSHRAVAVHVRVDDRLHAAADERCDRRRGASSSVRSPASRWSRRGRSRTSTADRDPLAVLRASIRRGRRSSRNAAVPITIRAAPAPSAAATSVALPQPAAVLDRHAELARRSARGASRFTGRPSRAPSRSTTCSRRAPCVDPAARRVERIGRVLGLARRSRPASRRTALPPRMSTAG